MNKKMIPSVSLLIIVDITSTYTLYSYTCPEVSYVPYNRCIQGTQGTVFSAGK